MNPWWKDFLMRLLFMFLALMIVLSVVSFAGFIAMCFQIIH